jgi:hypothetical protein
VIADPTAPEPGAGAPAVRAQDGDAEWRPFAPDLGGEMILTRSRGQSDYAAIITTRAFNSNSIGLT